MLKINELLEFSPNHTNICFDKNYAMLRVSDDCFKGSPALQEVYRDFAEIHKSEYSGRTPSISLLVFPKGEAHLYDFEMDFDYSTNISTPIQAAAVTN